MKDKDGLFLPLEDGYYAIMREDNFFGMNHWDLTFVQLRKVMYHATLSKPISTEEIKEQFEFYKQLIGGLK